MIEVLVGMIASGKSTYARLAASRGAIVISDDAITTAVHGGDYRLYETGLKPLYKGIENMMAVLAVSKGKNVVIDNSNRKELTRMRWTTLASSLDVLCVARIFPMQSPAVHAGRRFTADPRGLTFAQWGEVALRHQREYEEVSLDEGFQYITRVP